MRLLHTSTLGVIPFIEGNNSSAITSNANEYPALTIPKYAILSHTWEDGEVTLQEIQDDREVIKAKAGYQKVKASCELAKRDGFEYIWIDTCCIDKTNSTELFEAINSMFRWYKNSSICYVYLADAEPRDDLSIVGPMPFEGSIEYTFRWYSRGWTLQELIALRNVSFFSKNWKFLGTKVDHLVLLSSATGIDPYSLNGGDLSRISVARRMSWLASRQTTRLEDIAYCMLGIFGINMPLLYGEGERAFVRLQEEILKNSNDQSLFVWKEPDSMDFYREDYGESYSKSGLLASSPAHFEIARSVARFHNHQNRSEILYSKEGVTGSFLTCLDSSYQSGSVYMAVLDCPMGHIPGVFAGIRLKRISAVSNLFCRIDVPKVFTFCRRTSDGQIDLEGFDPRKKQDELFDLSRGIVFKDWTPQTIVVKNNFQSPLSPGFWFVPTNIHYIPDERSYARYSMSIEDVHPKNFWDSNTSTIQPTGQEYNSNITVLFRFRFDSKQLVLAAGSFSTPTGSKPWCKFIPTSLIEGLERSEPAIAWGSWRRLRERRVWNGFNTIDDLDNKVKHIIETHSQTASTKDQPAYSPMHLVGQSDWNEELSLAVRVEKKSILGPRNVCHSFEARYYTEPGNSTFTKTKLKKVETSTDIGLRKRGY